MIGSTTPVAEPDWHPVHRANAMLRAALLSSTHPAAQADDLHSVETLSYALDSVMQGPVSISFPEPLAARLDALELEDAFPEFESLTEEVQHDAEGDQAEEDFPDIATLTAGPPLDPAWHPGAAQVHVQALLQEFHRRQRRASLLVTGSVITAIVLTVGGLWLAVNFAMPYPAGSQNSPLRSTSVAWQRPVHAQVLTNRDAKGEPLLVPALATPLAKASPQAQTFLATSGREIAFAALLPPSRVGYFLIRGLPAEARLSAGRRSDSGTWLVKAQQASALTLSLGAVPSGHYPVEIYVLQSGDTPQARRSLVLRVETPAPAYDADTDRGWTSALLDLVPAARAAESPALQADPAALQARAKRLLDEGDIAAARLLLHYLAERGQGEAAYELGRTYDRDMLAELGARGIDGDLASARGWYQRAAQSGNAKAAERLRILASLSGSGPSD